MKTESSHIVIEIVTKTPRRESRGSNFQLTSNIQVGFNI